MLISLFLIFNHSLLALCDLGVLRKKMQDINYEKLERPFANDGKPVTITAQIFVRKISKFDVINLTYQIIYFLRMRWVDPRLASNGSNEVVTYDRGIDDLIWTPRLYLVNSDEDKMLDDNGIKCDIQNNGNVMLSLNKITVYTCMMNLSSYPFDIQHCPLEFEHYAQTIKNIRLKWHADAAVEVPPSLKIPGYHLLGTSLAETESKYSSGTYDNLKLTFTFKRSYLYVLYRVYIPISLLMIFNMGSYWIPDTAIPARMGLIMTTFLTNIFILQSVSDQTVATTTTTSLQVFVLFSIIMIVLAMVEYMVVLRLKTRKKFIQIDPQTPNEANNSHADDPLEENTTHILDKVFRGAGPMAYLIFIIGYYAHYMPEH